MGKPRLFGPIRTALFLVLLLGVLGLRAGYAQTLDAHPGYLSSVEGERYQLSREVVILPEPPPDRQSLQARIFTDKLTKDFQQRYEDQFGRTQGEQIESIPMRFYEKELQPGIYVTEEEYVNKQRRFGQYMAKRLVEYHVDNYLRETPSARPMYELKEKVSNVNLQVRRGYKVRLKYSFSGNYLDVNLENPYNIGAKVTFEDMGRENTIASLTYPLTKTVTLMTDYRDYQDQVTLSATKQLSPALSTSITGVSNNIENKGILSMRWVD